VLAIVACIGAALLMPWSRYVVYLLRLCRVPAVSCASSGNDMNPGAPISDLRRLVQSMQPTLNPGVYAFAAVPAQSDVGALQPIATFREAEGLSVIVEEQRARQAGLRILFRAAWITLSVHSDLQAVGLTAAVATALTRENISCNVVAAALHDHIFVPVEAAERALATLQALEREAGAAVDVIGAS
jgi:hypothetical protein